MIHRTPPYLVVSGKGLPPNLIVIYRFSSGAARLINKVCTHCLLYGAQNNHRIIDDHMVKRVIQGELS